MSKLALGTAQFGMNYGISNTTGIVSEKKVSRILEYARTIEVNLIDTSSNYGISEAVLGSSDLKNYKIVTKGSNFAISNGPNDTFHKFNESIKKLNINSVYSYMFHNEQDLLGHHKETLFNNFVELKNDKKIQKIGLSCYNLSNLYEIIDSFEIDIVQLPINVFDQRFLEILPLLKEKKIEVHARSIFLQGLLMMELSDIKSYFNPIYKKISSYHSELQKKEVSLLDGAMNFVKKIPQLDYIVVGISCLSQLISIYESYNKVLPDINYIPYKCDEDAMVDPSKWKI